jgi:poly-D-alanine transfer protein DltD
MPRPMIRSGWTVALLLLMLCAVALGACGGNSSADNKAQYKKEAKAIIDQAKGSLQTLQSRVSGKTADQQLQELAKTRQEVVSAADRLAKLTPPAGVKAEHDTFVAALRTFGQDFQKVEAAGKARNKQAAQQALTQLQTDAGQLGQASNALEAKLK